jgi:hypothetical protein
MNVADRMARDAANHLQGTCKSVHDLGPQFEELQNNSDFCATLDSLVFCCEECEWWHDVAEIHLDTGSGFICNDCACDEDGGDCE